MAGGSPAKHRPARPPNGPRVSPYALFGGIALAVGLGVILLLMWGVGLNWYLNSNIRLYVDYETTYFQGGATKPRAVTAQDERVILGRVQFSF